MNIINIFIGHISKKVRHVIEPIINKGPDNKSDIPPSIRIFVGKNLLNIMATK